MISLALCVNQFFVAVTKFPERNNLKEERFTLVYSFRGSSPWTAGSITVGLIMQAKSMEESFHLMGATKGPESRYALQRYAHPVTNFLQIGPTS
jgi:hypothetical protein